MPSVFRASLPALVLLSLVPTAVADAARVNWSEDIETALQQANQSGRLVFLKFSASWCGPCKRMERETFTQPAVASLVNQNFIPVLVDADKHKKLLVQLKIRGVPAMLVVSPEMVILERISGFQTAEKLLPKLNAIVARHQPSPTAVVAADTGGPPALPVSRQTVSAPTTAGDPNAAAHPDVFDHPAFGGLCLPAVRETRSLVSGLPQLAMRYRGRTLYFSNQEQVDKFRATPSKYWPQRDGRCPVTLLETGQRVDGKLQYAATFRGQLWVMQTAEAMQKFVADPTRYANPQPNP